MKHAIAALLLLAVLAGSASARPAYRRALFDLLELPTSSKLNDCQVCHLPAKKGDDENDRPHNAFGARLKAVRADLRKANKPSDVVSRILAVADEDADKDGTANLLELLAGTFPGDADSKPSEKELAAAKKRLPPLLASLKGYRWRPFDRVERPPLPSIEDAATVRNPIDLFLTAEMDQHGLKPRPEAPKEVLLRRVTIDLTGLPPTPEELRAFLADDSPDAYERVVDRLLSSSRYGERWGRHWMDVWRYSDWAGFGAQVRDSLPHVWRWRDWIVESLNAGKGYDRMILEMLAADELAPTDNDALRATGFLVRNYKLLSREKWLQDAVDHTAQAFMGLTLGCARCHDHQYDPITLKEYYQVRAIFQPHNLRTDRLPKVDPAKSGLPRAYDADLTAKTFVLLRGDERTPDKTPLTPGVPEALGGTFEVKQVELPRDAYDPERRAFVAEEQLAALKAEVERTRAALLPKLAAALVFDADALRTATKLVVARSLTDSMALQQLDAEIADGRLDALEAVLKVEALEPAGPKPSDAYQAAAKETVTAQRRLATREAERALLLARRAEAAAPAQKRAALTKQRQTAEQALEKANAAGKAHALEPTTNYVPRPMKTYPTTSTGRRLAFARWIANRDNPLAARVAVNHVWLRHFGAALAPGVFDLGRNAQKPTHPALLDWLAVEFMERGWSLKELHRLILTSAAYRRHSTPDRDSLARDPDNVYLWRFAPRRAEAEVVRDSVVFVADRLDETRGGPDLPHAQGLTVNRRSIYFQHAQEKQVEFLLLFDTAAVTECYQRRQAIMPQQALALSNSELSLRHARLTARNLDLVASDDAGRFVALAFEKLLSRSPTDAEKKTCVGFLKEQAAKFAALSLPRSQPDRDGAVAASDPNLRARENLVHVLFNHHEFVTIR